jgi:hypothetical protein
MLSADTTVDVCHAVAPFVVSRCERGAGFVVTSPTGMRFYMSMLPVGIAACVDQTGLFSLVGQSLPGSDTAQWLKRASAQGQQITHSCSRWGVINTITDYDQVTVLDNVDLNDRIFVFCPELDDAPPLYSQAACFMDGTDRPYLRNMALWGIYREMHLAGVSLDHVVGVTLEIPTKMAFLLDEPLPDGFILYRFHSKMSSLYLIDTNTVFARLASEELTPSDDNDSELVYLDVGFPRASKGKRPSHTASHTSFPVRGGGSVVIQKRQAIVGKLPTKADPPVCTSSLKDNDAVPRDRAMINAHRKSNPRRTKPCEIERGQPKTHDSDQRIGIEGCPECERISCVGFCSITDYFEDCAQDDRDHCYGYDYDECIAYDTPGHTLWP